MARNPQKKRCRARTRSGQRCKSWSMVGKGYCSAHSGLSIPPRGDSRRCEARRQDGERCRNWGLKDSEKIHGRVLCLTHAGEVLPKKGDERRCTAMTASGRRCRQWATKESRARGKGRCAAHAGRLHIPGVTAPSARRCTALTPRGARCKRWATPGSEARWGQRLCSKHAPNRHEPLPPEERRCTAVTASGEQCKHWALRDGHSQGEQPLCWVHAYPDQHGNLRHGFYRVRASLSDETRAVVSALEARGRFSEAALVVMRLKLRDVLAYVTEEELKFAQWITLARVVTTGLRAVGRSERARMELEPER